ncbi:MAG: hypothetical protein IM613_12915 [Cytophagales bacterium]|jgi:hypothetical protein|nr:hypothetical protein [Cytophagales bacterium]
MTENEAYDLGYSRGLEWGRIGSTLEISIEGEVNERLFVDFAPIWNLIESQKNASDLWNIFDEAVYDGIKRCHGYDTP